MPQANITYDVPYNRKLVDFLKELDEKHWRKLGTAYAPTMFQEKLGNFHGSKIGGGSPANQMYALSGNSPAYPPINMNSGLAVHSGGAYSGVDGAVGGAHHPVMAVGGAKVPVVKILKSLAPFAPLLLGLGHPSPSSKMDVVNALAPLGAMKSHSFKKLHELIHPYKTVGGYSFGRLMKDLGRGVKTISKNPVVRQVGQELLREGLKTGKEALLSYAKGSKSGAGRKRSNSEESLESMVEMVRPMEAAVSKGKGKKGGKFNIGKMFKSIVKNPIVKEVGKELLKEGIKTGVKAIASGAGQGGRQKRAEIVKRVMREKGLKMIEASKYVKAHGLYKP